MMMMCVVVRYVCTQCVVSYAVDHFFHEVLRSALSVVRGALYDIVCVELCALLWTVPSESVVW